MQNVFINFKLKFRVVGSWRQRFIKKNFPLKSIASVRKCKTVISVEFIRGNIIGENGAFARAKHNDSVICANSRKCSSIRFSIRGMINIGSRSKPDGPVVRICNDCFYVKSVFLAVFGFCSFFHDNIVGYFFVFRRHARIRQENHSQCQRRRNAENDDKYSCFLKVHYTFHPFFDGTFAERKNAAVKGVRSVSGKGNKAFGVFGSDIVFCSGKDRFVAGNLHIPYESVIADPDQRVEPVNVKSKRRKEPPEVIFPADMGTFVGNYGINFRLVIEVEIHRKNYLRVKKPADNGSFEKLRKADFVGVFDTFEPELSEHRKIPDHSEKEQCRRSENPDRAQN